MKQKQTLVILTCLFLLSIPVMGQETEQNIPPMPITHGYRAFVDAEGLTHSTLDHISALGISTTHGYQFNPHFFAGVGAGVFALMGGFPSVVFADFRYDEVFQGQYTPFVDVRLISNMSFNSFVVRPSIGYRYRHFNVSAGYWLARKSDTLFSIGVGLDFGGRKK